MYVDILSLLHTIQFRFFPSFHFDSLVCVGWFIYFTLYFFYSSRDFRSRYIKPSSSLNIASPFSSMLYSLCWILIYKYCCICNTSYQKLWLLHTQEMYNCCQNYILFYVAIYALFLRIECYFLSNIAPWNNAR